MAAHVEGEDVEEFKDNCNQMPKIEINQLGIAVASRVPAVIAASAWEVCEIRTSLKKMHLEEIVQECENMAKYTHEHKPSVLRDKSFSAMQNFNWATLLNEARNRCPTLLDVVTAICNRRDAENVLRSGAQRVAPIGTILAMLLHQYNRTLSLVQRVSTVLLANGHVEKKFVNELLMKKESVREVGTLKYFRERIVRYNVHPEIKKDVEAFQDFLSA